MSNSTFWDTTEKAHQSWLWKQILRQRDTIRDALACLVGDGNYVDMWDDRWVHNKVLKDIVPSITNNMVHVSDFICQGQWKEKELNYILPPEVVQEIVGIPLPRTSKPDRLVLAPDPTGNFTIKSTYTHLINSQQNLTPNWPWLNLWKLKTLPRIKFFLWLLIWDRLLTASLLCKRGELNSPICPCCDLAEEITSHLLLHCQAYQQVLQRSGSIEITSIDQLPTLIFAFPRDTSHFYP